jgi:hypothetical protein
MCRSKLLSFLLYASYARTHCCSSVSTIGGNNPCRPNSLRSSSLKAVPLFSTGSDIKSFPEWSVTIFDSGISAFTCQYNIKSMITTFCLRNCNSKNHMEVFYHTSNQTLYEFVESINTKVLF